MKEIQELVKELKNVAARCDLDNDYDLNDCAEDIREIAGRLEKAVMPCNQQKMRNALLAAKKLFDGKIMFQNSIREAHKAVNDALAEPPRNCDFFTEEELCEIVTKEAKAELPNVSKEILDVILIMAEGVIKTLFAKTKGEEK